MDDLTLPRQRGVFCNRTLNLRSIGAIGYDMDYTLVQYDVIEWEALAYSHTKERFVQQGWSIADLVFDPQLMVQGLIIDKELGNLLKANRFGFVKQAFHGTEPMSFDDQRKAYARTIVDHREPRFAFLSTLFSVSEACLFAQLVELYDDAAFPQIANYGELYDRVRGTIDAAHREGHLKAEILQNLDRYVDLEERTCEVLRDQRDAGKKLLLITNSDWAYTRTIMAHCFDRFLPSSMSWRDLFDLVIISARKPDFFVSNSPLLEVFDDEGLLKPLSNGPVTGGVYFGGNASMIEEHLGLSGDQILFVGDHFFGDVHATKKMLRWRTALILKELEGDVAAAETFAQSEQKLEELMQEKEALETRYCHTRLRQQRARGGREPEKAKGPSKAELEQIRKKLEALDEHIAPLARQAAQIGNSKWGPLMRAGNDKSYLAELVERHADIYTSRVSNLLPQTPYRYFRSARGSLPHDG